VAWIVGRHGWLLPWLVIALVLSATGVVDRQWGQQQEARGEAAESRAQGQVSALAEALGRVVSERLGALAVPKLRFAPDSDSTSERAFVASVDSVRLEARGLVAISAVSREGEVTAGRDALMGRAGVDPRNDDVVRQPFLAALARDSSTATVVDHPLGRRIVVLEPIDPPGGGALVALLAVELDPVTLYGAAVSALPDSIRSGFYGLQAPDGRLLNPSRAPPGWPTVERPVRIADTEWIARLSYAPVDRSANSGVRLAIWVTGLAMATVLGTILTVLRATVRRQRDEIAHREEAEQRVRSAAAEARGLSAQLQAAHTAAQRLSTSLDPEYVLEFFLGTVAEVLRADAATLYTFDDEGDLVGRSRLILREVGPETERLRGEDIRAVRVPAAMLPQLAEAVSTGNPKVVDDARRMREATGIAPGAESAASWVTIPLQVGGNIVGVAIWEVFGEPHPFDPKDVAFAKALGAQAAAALRTAELYATLQELSARATWEATRFGAILDQMTDGVVIADADGRVERVNQAAIEYLGSGAAGPVAGEWVKGLELIGHDRRAAPAQEFPLLRALGGERVRRVDLIARSATREDRHLSLSATPILTESGERSGAAMIVRDNTDEQQYAELLRHTNQELRKHAALLEETNEQLRAATAAKDQFLAVVSHELRTPVNAIMGYAELLDLEIKGPLNGDQKVMLRRLRSTAWHLLGLINEILDLPKVASGDVRLKLEKVELREILDSALHQITPIADTKGLELKAVHGVGPAHRDLVAIADRRRLTQVVLNLLSNAVKFTEKGGVTLRSCPDDDGFVQVRVRDTGQGIPEDQQERIFDEFYQIEGGLTRRVGGTGLGLAITRKFTRLMGGDVTVESRPGEGAEFIVKLPAASA
jgi:PAS domain S-box-containing protein